MRISILCDWCENSSKMQMLNCHLIHCMYLPDLAPSDFWLFSTLKKHLHGCQFALDNKVINQIYPFFNSLPQAKFEKTIKVKWAEVMKLHCEWELVFWESTNQENCESDVAMNKIFFLVLLFTSGHCNYSYWNLYILLRNYCTEAFSCSFGSSWNALHDQLPENYGRWRSECISRNSTVFWDNPCKWSLPFRHCKIFFLECFVLKIKTKSILKY